MNTAGRQKFSVLIESKDFARPPHSHSNSILSTRRFEKEPLYNSRQCLAATSVLNFWNFRLMLAEIHIYCVALCEFLAFVKHIDSNRRQRALVPCTKLLYYMKIKGKYDKYDKSLLILRVSLWHFYVARWLRRTIWIWYSGWKEQPDRFKDIKLLKMVLVKMVRCSYKKRIILV